MTTDQLRADFEAWAEPRAYNLDKSGVNVYADKSTQFTYIGYCASHAKYAPRWHPASEPPPDCGDGTQTSEVVLTKDDSGDCCEGFYSYDLSRWAGSRTVARWTPIPPDTEAE